MSDERWVQLAELAELGLLSASLVHELRHPVFAMRATLQLAHGRGQAVEGPALNLLLDQIEHMDTLLSHYSGLAATRGDAQLFDVEEPVDSAMVMLEHRIRQLGVVVRRHRSTGAWVQGRSTGVRQVMVNLLQNALDALEDVSDRELIVETGGDEHEVWIVLRDSGSGIPMALRDTLMDPFVTSKPEGRGTGLGLSIAARLLDEIGGSLILSPLPHGTKARVSLKRARAGAPS